MTEVAQNDIIYSMKIKLSEWAKRNAVCYKTAWRYFKEGKFAGKSEVNEAGSIFILEEPENLEEKIRRIINQELDKRNV